MIGVLSTRSDETIKHAPADQEARRARVQQRIDTLTELARVDILERMADFGEREIGRCAS